MRHAQSGILGGLLMLLLASTVWALTPIPLATGYVTDQTGLMDPAEMTKTQVLLGKYEVTTGRKVSVLMVQSTSDEALEAFGDRVMQAWKMDDAQKGGALLLWSADGYIVMRVAGPLGQRLDDEAQQNIMSRWIVPQFAQGEAGTGIRQGVERMIAVLDGGDVGFPDADADADADADSAPATTDAAQADDAASMAEEAAADVAADAAAPDQDPDSMAAANPGSESEITMESPVGMPPWVERLPEEFSGLMGRFSDGPFAGLGGWFGQAGDQLSQLPATLSAIVRQIRGEPGGGTFHPVSIGAAYALAGLLVLAALLLKGRAFVASLVVAGLGGGIALWLATGLLALALLVMLAGVLAPVLVPILRALLRGANDSERDPMPSAFDPSKYASRPAQAPAARLRPAARSGAASQRPVARNLVSTTAYSQSKRQQRGEELVDLIKALAQTRIRQLKPIHGVVALALLVFAPVLAILGLLALITVLGYQGGVAYLLADLFVTEPGARERLKERLPKPKNSAE